MKSSSVGTALKDINFVLMVPGTDRFGAKKEKEAEDEEDVDAVRGWYDDLPVDDLSTLRGVTVEAAADETADEAADDKAADEEKMDCPDCRFLILETKANLPPDDLPTVKGVTFEAAAEDAVEEAVVEAAVKDVVVEAAVKDVVVEAAVDDVMLKEEAMDWSDRSFLILVFKKLILCCLSWDALYSSSISTSSCVSGSFPFFLLIARHLLYRRKSSASLISKVAFSAARSASKSSTLFLFRPTELLAALLHVLSVMIVHPMAPEIVGRSRK